MSADDEPDVYPNAGGPLVTGTTIGQEPTEAQKQLFERWRTELLRRIEDRRKRGA